MIKIIVEDGGIIECDSVRDAKDAIAMIAERCPEMKSEDIFINKCRDYISERVNAYRLTASLQTSMNDIVRTRLYYLHENEFKGHIPKSIRHAIVKSTYEEVCKIVDEILPPMQKGRYE